MQMFTEAALLLAHVHGDRWAVAPCPNDMGAIIPSYRSRFDNLCDFMDEVGALREVVQLVWGIYVKLRQD